MEEKNVRRGDFKKGFLWFGLGFLILVGAIVGSFFTNISAKVTRNLKEIAAPKPQPGPDRETLENGVSGKWGQCAKIDKISVTIAHPRKMGSGKWGQCAKIDKISVTIGKWGQMRR
jgi:hypothetical protein